MVVKAVLVYVSANHGATEFAITIRFPKELAACFTSTDPVTTFDASKSIWPVLIITPNAKLLDLDTSVLFLKIIRLLTPRSVFVDMQKPHW